MTPPTATLTPGSAYRIVIEDCIACGVCEQMCPNKAIVHTEGEKDFQVLADECMNCGVCEIYCPTDAILEPAA